MAFLPRLAPIALALALAGPCATPARADDAREQQLETRVTELERHLQAVLAALEAQKGAAPAPVASAASAGAKQPSAPIQDSTITPAAAPGTKFTFGGFAKAEALYTATGAGEIPDGSVGRDFYQPATIPVGAADEGTDLNAHAKYTRFWFDLTSLGANGAKAGAHLEFDLSGSALGDQRATNTYGLTTRQAYGYWNEWLAGQAWSNFMDPTFLPETTDLVGPTDGTVFVRQTQLRYTKGAWSFSLENPETTITPFHGGARISSDDNNLPDLTGKYTWKGPWGSMALAGMARQLKYETTGAGAVDDATAAYAMSFMGKVLVGRDDVRWAVTGGSGFGRYVSLNFANDAVLDANGELDAISGWAGYVGYRHLFTEALRGSLFYAAQHYANDQKLTGGAANASSYSVHANLFYTPLPKVDVGVEYFHARRELENGTDGDEDRVHLIAKYSF
jgi:hypothetical protein